MNNRYILCQKVITAVKYNVLVFFNLNHRIDVLSLISHQRQLQKR